MNQLSCVWVVVMMLENMWCLSWGRNLWTEVVGHVMQFRTTGHHHREMGIVVWVGWDNGDLAFIQLQHAWRRKIDLGIHMMTTCLKKKEIDSNKSIHLNRYIDWSMSVWFELAMLRVGCEGFPCQHKRSKRFWICRPKFWNWLVWRSSMANVKLWAHFLRELFWVTVVTWAFREL